MRNNFVKLTCKHEAFAFLCCHFCMWRSTPCEVRCPRRHNLNLIAGVLIKLHNPAVHIGDLYAHNQFRVSLRSLCQIDDLRGLSEGKKGKARLAGRHFSLSCFQVRRAPPISDLFWSFKRLTRQHCCSSSVEDKWRKKDVLRETPRYYR